MKQKIRFNTLINQKDPCIIVSFREKNTTSKGYINLAFSFMLQEAFTFYVSFTFCVCCNMKNRKLMMSDIWEQFVNYEYRADLLKRSQSVWTD